MLLATFFVTNTDDSGAGSLRQAILDANADAVADRIEFNIPGTGPHSIRPTTPLPAVAQPVVIDGYTQPGASVNSVVIRSPIQSCSAIRRSVRQASPSGLMLHSQPIAPPVV